MAEGQNHKIDNLYSSDSLLLADLGRSLDSVGVLVASVGPDQWSASTPCVDWDVRRLVQHLTGMNLVFAALLLGEAPPPRPTQDHVEADPVGAYRKSAAALQDAFARPGVLARLYEGPLGSATGMERLQIRMYDLLAHGWDLAQAIRLPADLPEDVAEQSLAFARGQVADQSRPGRFEPPRACRDDAPAIDRLAAFLGRPTSH